MSSIGNIVSGLLFDVFAICSVHGEFRFSPLTMPPPMFTEKTGDRLCGEDITAYMENFAGTFLAGKIRFETEVLDIRRGRDGAGWEVEVLDLRTGNKDVLNYARIVLCTGVRASEPTVPVLTGRASIRDSVELSFLRRCRQSLRNKQASTGLLYIHPRSHHTSIKFSRRPR